MGFLDFLHSGTLSGTVQHFVLSYYQGCETLRRAGEDDFEPQDVFYGMFYIRQNSARMLDNSRLYDRVHVHTLMDLVESDFALFIMFLLMLDSGSYRNAFRYDPVGYYNKVNKFLIKHGYSTAKTRNFFKVNMLPNFFYQMVGPV